MSTASEKPAQESPAPPDMLVEVRLDARQIRTLAHPLRARLLGHLRTHGPATATRLAEVLATNTGATSYHLRQLAEVGLVREDDHASRGRERWWRAAHDVSSWWRKDFAGDDDATAAVDWLAAYQVHRLAESAEAWQRAVGAESDEWRDAAGLSDYLLDVNPEQLRALVDDLDAVIERHRLAAAATPPDDRRQVQVYVLGHPRVEPS
jgi:predicted ArsR family transcriptional regulator